MVVAAVVEVAEAVAAYESAFASKAVAARAGADIGKAVGAGGEDRGDVYST